MFPVPLGYRFEASQGKSRALNTGLSVVSAPVITFTDDDVEVAERWLEAGCGPLMSRTDVDYTGGPVYPLWEQRRPAWLDTSRHDLWGTLAILDYGSEPFVFEERRRVPLGANMAVKRSLIERVGGFHPNLGRTGNSLLGQEQAEFFSRTRAVGARGLYVPAMFVHHHVPGKRLSRQYFRRWWYWKGRSRARLERIHPVTELGLDLSRVRRVAGVPRFMFGTALRDARGWLVSLLAGRPPARLRHEVMLWYFVGYLRGWREGRDGDVAPRAVVTPARRGADAGKPGW
jgi:glycosyltransferase involved in cell wall biosynthesis